MKVWISQMNCENLQVIYVAAVLRVSSLYCPTFSSTHQYQFTTTQVVLLCRMCIGNYLALRLIDKATCYAWIGYL
jgi:hypothetical protein